MRNLISSILVCLLFVSGLVSCKRNEIISDRELKEILKEVFITNAYFQTEPKLNPTNDSLDIYRPILKRHGYKVADFEYTMLSFAKRKSSRLSKILEGVIAELEREESDLRYRASMYDSVKLWSQQRFMEVVMQDSSFKAMAVKDTANLRIAVPVKEGEYHITYSYLIDTTDKNKGLRTFYNVKNSGNGTVISSNSWMTVRRRQKYTGRIDVVPGQDTLEIVFGNYPKKGMTKPAMSIDSLKIVYMPTPEKAMRDITKTFINYRIPVDTGYIRRDTLITDYEYSKDSGTLYIYPLWLP